MCIRRFPFELVKRDSRIILYGAGEIGQTYLHQIRLTQYCTVVCLIDREFSRYTSLPFDVCSVNCLPEKQYDFIVIANKSPAIADEIRAMLMVKYGLAQEKIIYANEFLHPIFPLCDTEEFLPEEALAFSRKGKYAIAIRLVGGLGDFIVRKKNIQELASWDNDLSIDIYVNKSKKSFADILFCDIPHINKIIGTISEYHVTQSRYAAAFGFDTMLQIDSVNEFTLETLPSILQDKILSVQKKCLAYGNELNGIFYAIHYARCEKDGLNCYTNYNRYGVFHVDDYHTTIPFTDGTEKDFVKLGLGQHYITLNYGWDKSMGSEKTSAKVWPLEYFSCLAKMIHDTYTECEIVQIGLNDTPKIENCNHYLLGRDIELIKHVLKNSTLHIDCEGGMVHLASQFDTKCIVLFGPTPVAYYGYPSNINIVAGSCKNCIWLVPDYISCYRNLEKPECMYSILPEQVFEKVRECLVQT